jgi:hypothetical protein
MNVAGLRRKEAVLSVMRALATLKMGVAEEAGRGERHLLRMPMATA